MKPGGNDTGFRIKEVLAAHPKGLDVTSISRKVGKTRNVIAKHLGILSASGQLDMMHVGTAKLYTLAKRIPVSALFEFSSDYVIVIDERSTIVRVNANLLTLLDQPGDAIVGQNLIRTSHPFLRHLPVRELSDITGASGAQYTEFSGIVCDRPYWFSVKQVPIMFSDEGMGQILLIEDITKRREAEEEIRNYLLAQEFFSKKLQEFAELPPEADIYTAIGAGLDDLLPNAIIDVNLFDPATHCLKKRALFGPRGEEFVQRTAECNCNWDSSPAYETVPEILRSGTLFRLPGKFHYASFEQVSEEDSRAIEQEFNLGDFYSIGLVWRGNLLGNILFILKEGSTISNASFIELYARAASIALQRHLAEEAARNRLAAVP